MKQVRPLLQLLITCMAMTLLTACDQQKWAEHWPKSWPEYWLCHGSTTQRVYDQEGVLLEKYAGSDPIMLEIFGGKIYQFLSPSYSGEYKVCDHSSSSTLFNFESGNCLSGVMGNDLTSDKSQFPLRKASLDKNTGKLTISEKRLFQDKNIVSEGDFVCRNLGNTFSFNDFNHAKD